MGGWYLLVYSYSFNQLKIKILLTHLLLFDIGPVFASFSTTIFDSKKVAINVFFLFLFYFYANDRIANILKTITRIPYFSSSELVVIRTIRNDWEKIFKY